MGKYGARLMDTLPANSIKYDGVNYLTAVFSDDDDRVSLYLRPLMEDDPTFRKGMLVIARRDGSHLRKHYSQTVLVLWLKRRGFALKSILVCVR